MELERIGHFVRLPVELCDTACRLLLDSGIGLTVVAPSLVERLNLTLTGGSFAGQRMSGQAVTAPLVSLPRLRVGDYEIRDAVVGVAELGPTEGPVGLDGILGLDLLSDMIVSVDTAKGLLLERDPAFESRAIEVPVRVQRDGPAVSLFVDLVLPSGRTVEVEVDTGSNCLILHSRFMADCRVLPEEVQETISGTDETGFRFVRSFATATGAIQLAEAPLTAQESPRTMFQDIIHEGLIGTEFLDRFIYSFDVSRSRMVLLPRR